MFKKTTLRDIAEDAQVSIATVSYVLNDVPHQKIPRDTRERVLEAAKRLNYVQNLTARSLARGSSSLIGVLFIATGTESLPRLRSYARFLEALERQLGKAGYHLLVSHLHPNDPQANIVLERRLDGVFIVDACAPSFHKISARFEFGSPVVLIDSLIEDSLFRFINPDWAQLFALARSGGSDSLRVIYPPTHNAGIQLELERACGLGPKALLCTEGQEEEALAQFIREQPAATFVVVNEFLALKAARYCSPEQLVVACTTENPELVPPGADCLQFTESRAACAVSLMEKLLKQPFEQQDSDYRIPFARRLARHS